ncbi:exported hypothetical protein [Burkholderia sp. IT-111MI5]
MDAVESAQSLRSRCAAALTGTLLLALAPVCARAEVDPAAALPPAAAIDAVIAAEIADRHLAGAVVVTGDADGVPVRVARGFRVTGTAAEAMTADTVFDLASLTKPVATAVAVMQLAERGELDLDTPAAHYWPAFAARGKAGITLRQLLAHTSGLPPGVSSSRALRSRAAVLADIVAMAPDARRAHGRPGWPPDQGPGARPDRRRDGRRGGQRGPVRERGRSRALRTHAAERRHTRLGTRAEPRQHHDARDAGHARCRRRPAHDRLGSRGAARREPLPAARGRRAAASRLHGHRPVDRSGDAPLRGRADEPAVSR